MLSGKLQGELQAISTVHTDMFDKIQHYGATDPSLVLLISQIQQGTKSSTKYVWQYNQLKRKGKLVVGSDPELRIELLQYVHSSNDGGYSGVKVTMTRINSVV